MYFTYAAHAGGQNEAKVATEADQRLRSAIVKAGGAISNHHGIGKFRSQLLLERMSRHNAELVHAAKHTLDANNVFGAANGVFASS